MSSLFPAPVHAYTTHSDAPSAPSVTALAAPAPATAPTAAVPKYPLRRQAKFIPRSQADFGDGGAYPEIHLAQFPLGMGKKGSSGGGGGGGSASNTLALQVRGDDGQVSYDAIVTQHHRDKTKVFTKFSDLVEKDHAPLALPSKEEEEETANRTREALQSLIQGKIAAAHPVNVNRQKTATESSSFVRYTPHNRGTSQGQQRIIRMVEVAKDPMEPPKFQHKKAVRGPPSPPVPVLHSPPRKLTVQDQQSFKIPPVISNWKNSKGFTIALDKRLAADGRGLQQVTVNDNFASLAEALAIAERKAREEVNMRAQVQKKVAMKQKEQKENELREMAARARMERAGIKAEDEGDSSRGRPRQHSRSRTPSRSRSRSRSRGASSDEEDREGLRERERIRRERKKEREREMRLEKLGKKGKLARDDDRDVSEKIALGQLQGISSGFGGDDEYSVYSKPMVDRGKASVYRPKADEGTFDADREYEDLKGGHAKRFKADRQFRGTEEVGRGRDGPVQFSYDETKDDDDQDTRRDRGRPRRRSPSRSRSRSRSFSRSASPAASGRRGPKRRSPSRSRSHRRSSSRSRSLERDRKRRRRGRSASASSDSDDPYGLDQFLTDARKSSAAKTDQASPRRRR